MKDERNDIFMIHSSAFILAFQRRRVNSDVILLSQIPALFSIDTPPERIYICGMDYNEDRVDDMVLALLHLTSFGDRGFVRAWKGHDWDALNRLHQKGFPGMRHRTTHCTGARDVCFSNNLVRS